MSKLKKHIESHDPDESITISKYITFQDDQTQLPQPVFNNNSSNHDLRNDSPPQKKTKKSAKKPNKSLKKQNPLPDDQQQIGKPVSRRKTRPKKNPNIEQIPQIVPQLEKENHSDNSRSSKIKKTTEKRQKSQRKSNKKQKKQALTYPAQDSENNFRNNLDQSIDTLTNKPQIRQDFNQIKSNQSQRSSESINFNRRLRKSKDVKKIEINAILSSYAQDQVSVNYNGKTSEDDTSYRDKSDLTDYELLGNKKQKKTKKQQGPKINNKFFKDIHCPETSNDENKYQGEDPPEDCGELIIQSKEPRKTFVNFTKIQQKATQAKDKRDMKVVSNDAKTMHQFKSTIREIKDVDEVEIAVQNPKLAKKKGASGALHLKNNIEKQHKLAKNTQFQSQTALQQQQTQINKVSGPNEAKLQRTGSTIDDKQRKQQQYVLKEKRKGVERGEFQKRLIEGIKLKRQTTLHSQEVFANVKSTSLDDADFDIDLAENALSNCSSRSGSRMKESKFDRRMSVDSQNSRKSQDSKKSLQSSLQRRPEDRSLTEARESQNSVNRSQKNHAMAQTMNIDLNSNSRSFATNRFSRNFVPLEKQVISQAKQSDISSSLPNMNASRNFNSNLNQISNNQKHQQSLKESVKKTFAKSYQLFESQNEPQQLGSNQSESTFNQQVTIQELVENQKVQDKKLARRLVKKSQKKTKPSGGLEDSLGTQNEEKQENKKKTKSKKPKKSKSSTFSIETYFEDQAQYSSSEEGHTDQEENLQKDEDVDIDGNIRQLIDEDTNVFYNERAVRKKFIQDEEKREEEDLKRIMKKMFAGKHLSEETQSDKKRKQRMVEAAQRNRLKQLLNEGPELQTPIQIKPNIVQNCVDVEIDENSNNRKKIEMLQQELLYGGVKIDDFGSIQIKPQTKPFEILNTIVHESQSHRVSIFQRKDQISLNSNQGKSIEPKKSLMDQKKNSVQQQIHNKRKTVEKRGQSNGNRNKMQKTSALQLEIRTNNTKNEDDIQI